MVKITPGNVVTGRQRPKPPRVSLAVGRWIFFGIFAVTTFCLMFVFASITPYPPYTPVVVAPWQNGVPATQLATPNNTKITTDVRGNLGPPQVMIQDGSDWIKDRWQAASDMHGTAIKGKHEVLLSFHFPLALDAIKLDWEAAYSKDYVLEGAMANMVWFTLFDTRDTNADSNLLEMGPTQELGQSPGVKTKTPLHIIHPFTRKNHTATANNEPPQVMTTNIPPQLQYLRLTIRSSAMGWGVSLWRIQVFGWPLPRTQLLRKSA